MNDVEKKYWKKVFMYFGNDFEGWWRLRCTDESHPIIEPYFSQNIRSYLRFREYFNTKTTPKTFTEKFLNEVMDW